MRPQRTPTLVASNREGSQWQSPGPTGSSGVKPKSAQQGLHRHVLRRGQILAEQPFIAGPARPCGDAGSSRNAPACGPWRGSSSARCRGAASCHSRAPPARRKRCRSRRTCPPDSRRNTRCAPRPAISSTAAREWRRVVRLNWLVLVMRSTTRSRLARVDRQHLRLHLQRGEILVRRSGGASGNSRRCDSAAYCDAALRIGFREAGASRTPAIPPARGCSARAPPEPPTTVTSGSSARTCARSAGLSSKNTKLSRPRFSSDAIRRRPAGFVSQEA